MGKKRKLWNIASDGSVVTNTGYNFYKEESKADSIWEHKAFITALIIGCCLVDMVMFKSLFSQYSYDSPAEQTVETIGMLLCFDLLPVFIATQLRRKQQRLSYQKLLTIMAVLIVMVAIAQNFNLRFKLNDMQTDYSVGGQTYSEEVIVEGEESIKERDNTSITLLNSLLPVFTTCGTFFFSIMSSNPRKKEYLKALKKKCELEDDIERYDTNLKECEMEESMYENMLSEDDERYKCQEQKIREKEREYRSYVRDQLKIHVKDAAGISELSVVENPKFNIENNIA